MIVIFHGNDEFSAHEALAALEEELNDDGMLAGNTDYVDGASARPEELLALCQTMPFLSEHRLIVVEGLVGRFEPAQRQRTKRRAARPNTLGTWQSFIDGVLPATGGEPLLPEATVLVFRDDGLTAGNPMLQALRSHARVQEFPPLKQGDVAGWIVRRAQKYDLALDGRAVASLAALVGTELRTLDSELRKLAAYARGATITEEDVRSLVSLAREPNVFALADAVIEGRGREAAELVRRLLADGEAPQRLLAMVARQYRMLVQTKELQALRVRPAEMSAQLQVRGFVVQRLLKQAPLYTVEQLRLAYRRLLNADLSIKRGIFDGETATFLLVAELSTLGRAAPPDGRQGYSRRHGGPGSPPPAAAMGSSGRR